jgi:hypothetical protein
MKNEKRKVTKDVGTYSFFICHWSFFIFFLAPLREITLLIEQRVFLWAICLPGEDVAQTGDFVLLSRLYLSILF